MDGEELRIRGDVGDRDERRSGRKGWMTKDLKVV